MRAFGACVWAAFVPCFLAAGGALLGACQSKSDSPSVATATQAPSSAPTPSGANALAGPSAAPPLPTASIHVAPASAPAHFTSYTVTGVAANDTLNVRERPDAKSAKLAALPPGAGSIRGTGRTENAGGARWVEVTVGSDAGWVNGAFLTAETAAATAPVGASPATNPASTASAPSNAASAGSPATLPGKTSAPNAAVLAEMQKCPWSFGADPSAPLLDAKGDLTITEAGKPPLLLTLGTALVYEIQSPACGKTSYGRAMVAIQLDEPEFVTRLWFRMGLGTSLIGESKTPTNLQERVEYKRQHKLFVTKDESGAGWTKWSVVVTPAGPGPVEITFSLEGSRQVGDVQRPVSLRGKVSATLREMVVKF